MPKKTSTERVRAFRERQRAQKPHKKAPKSGIQRLREFRARQKALENGISEVDNDQNNSFSTTNIHKKTTKRKHQKQQEQYSFIQACTEALREKPESNSDDEFEALGKYIAKKLKRLKNRDQKILAESLLTQVLHKAALSKLTENTIIIESNSVNT